MVVAVVHVDPVVADHMVVVVEDKDLVDALEVVQDMVVVEDKHMDFVHLDSLVVVVEHMIV